MSIIPIKDIIVEKRVYNKVSSTIHPKKSKSKSKPTAPLLLIGPSGCGKTTLILSLAKHLKYNIQNIDPESDYENNKKSFFVKNDIILLDNLDEIKGKLLSEIVGYFVKDSRPLILVSNSITDSLSKIKKKFNLRATNYGFDLKEWVLFLEKKYKIEHKKVKHLVRRCDYNKGIAINNIRINITDLNTVDLSKNISKWEIYENAFNKDVDRRSYYFQENTLPLFVFDNYPKLKDNSIEYCANSASACAITDVMETFYKKRQYYEFAPYASIFTTEMATFNYNEKIKFPRFPEYYGKTRKVIKDKDSMLLEKQIKIKMGKKYKPSQIEEYNKMRKDSMSNNKK